jgi:hypothetical protein
MAVSLLDVVSHVVDEFAFLFMLFESKIMRFVKDAIEIGNLSGVDPDHG